jgi:DNA repair protein RAD16
MIVSPIQTGRSNVAMRRLKAVLSAIMLRRTKDVLKHANDDADEDMDQPKEEEDAVDSINTESTKVESTEIASATLKTEDVSSMEIPSSSASPAPIQGDDKAALSKKIALKLPTKLKTDELLSFSPHERALYNLLTRKGQETIRNAVCGGKKQSNYMNMLCILLRLRQGKNN